MQSHPTDGTNRDSGSPIDAAPVPVRQAADQAREMVGQAMDMAQQQASDQVGSQLSRVSGSLTALSQAVDMAGDELRRRNEPMLASAVDQAGQQVEQMAEYLRTSSLDQLVADTESLARRQPTLFLGGAFALGLLAARFLKASRPEPQGSFSGGYQSTRTSTSTPSSSFQAPRTTSGPTSGYQPAHTASATPAFAGGVDQSAVSGQGYTPGVPTSQPRTSTGPTGTGA